MADTNLIYPYELQGGQRAVASEVMANFEAVQLFAQGINTTINEFQAAISDLKNKPTREMFDIYYSITGETPIGAYPLWTGETITNCQTIYPQFWKKLKQLAQNAAVPTVESNAAYEEKLEQYGQCASFYIDELNGNVRLPKITRFISSISQLSEIGEYKSGLPNIAGEIKYLESASGESFATSGTGALSGENNGENGAGGSGGRHKHVTLKFNASQSNDIYGASEEVQPPAVRLYLYLQVANNTAEISELDVDAIIEQMNEALAALKTAYDGYTAGLNSEYQSIKQDIINSSPVIKENEVSSQGRIWEILSEDNEYYLAGYRYACALDVPDATVDLVPVVTFDIKDAVTGNFAPVAESGDSIVTIYAKEMPTAPITIPSIILQ